MSEAEDPDTAPAPPESASSTSGVGYRRPPVETRFKKGVSGNPRGRPRKRRPRPAQGRASVADLLIAEAYRPITIRENNEAVTLPMIQAVMRSLGVSAVKGSHRAQIAITNLLQAAEQREIDDRRAIFEAIVEYKRDWQETFQRYDAAGKPRPDPVPHPDDLAVDSRTGDVMFNGPFDDAEKAKWDKFRRRKQDALEEIEFNKKYQKRHKLNSDFYDRIIEMEQRLIDLVDRTFPDEETRRHPDFNINDWRRQQAEIQEMRAKFRRQRSP